MKKNIIKKTAVTLALAGTMVLSSNISAFANTTTMSRTKAWDTINTTLGGVPESVQKVEISGDIFYLGEGVTSENLQEVLAKGAEAFNMRTAPDSGKTYPYHLYILWNTDKTVLLVHPIIFSYDDILEAVAVSATTETISVQENLIIPKTEMPTTPTIYADKQDAFRTPQETVNYMLSAEYADAVREEFYRLINEYRVENGLNELQVDLELQAYTDIRAAEQRVRFGHTRPDGSGSGSGWKGTRVAENTAAASTLNPDPIETARSIFTKWKNSPGHNKVMLYNYESHVKMAFGIVPQRDEKGWINSGAVFQAGF